jgi:hypothetical protein
MIKKNFKKEVKEVVKKYFSSSYEASVSVFDELCLKFGQENLSPSQYRQLHKFMLLFFGTAFRYPYPKCSIVIA